MPPSGIMYLINCPSISSIWILSPVKSVMKTKNIIAVSLVSLHILLMALFSWSMNAKSIKNTNVKACARKRNDEDFNGTMRSKLKVMEFFTNKDWLLFSREIHVHVMCWFKQYVGIKCICSCFCHSKCFSSERCGSWVFCF